MSTDCVFCSIVAGRAPAEVVYEDDSVIGIMDIAPVTRGHSLIVVRPHRADIWDMTPEEVADAMAGAARLAVPHFHLHVIPRYRFDELTPPWPIDHRRGDPAAIRATADQIRG